MKKCPGEQIQRHGLWPGIRQSPTVSASHLINKEIGAEIHLHCYSVLWSLHKINTLNVCNRPDATIVRTYLQLWKWCSRFYPPNNPRISELLLYYFEAKWTLLIPKQNFYFSSRIFVCSLILEGQPADRHMDCFPGNLPGKLFPSTKHRFKGMTRTYH